MDLIFSEVIDRLKSKLNFTEDKELAELMGISQPAFSERRKRGALPYEMIINICRKHSISSDYIFTGHSEFFDGSITTAGELPNINPDTMIVIPYYQDIRCAAGSGCINDESSEDEISYIILPRDGYPELQRSSHHLHAITAQGDSMEGTIHDGAILLVDFTDKGFESGKIYVVNSGGEVLVKRIFIDPSNPESVILKSDNIYYPQFNILKENIEVIGRVVFVYNRAKLV